MVPEVRAWNRQSDQYFEVSALSQVEFSIQKSIFIQYLSEDMVSRLDSELERCASIEDMRQLIQDEFDKHNPRMVMRHK